MRAKHSVLTGMVAAVLVFLPMSACPQGSASEEKVVFHLDDSANARWALMLAKATLELDPDTRIVFVAYGPGVDFLFEFAEDRHGNPYDTAVSDLVEQGVDFRVCKATLEARGIAEDHLLDVVGTVPSGTHEIIRLQLQEGFAYLKP
jgi:intracellular sulfur oxidation DsrE/DsrF family protein